MHDRLRNPIACGATTLSMTNARRLGSSSLRALLLLVACDKQADSVAPAVDVAADDTPVALPEALHPRVKDSCGTNDGVLGTQLKPFELRTVDGESVNHRSWEGRVLLVNFWTTWCKPCLRELPHFEALHRHYQSHGLTLVAIAGDEDREPVQAYVEESDISAKVVMGTRDYSTQYGTTRYPFTLVVDAQGVIRASFFGYRSGCMGKIEAEIRRVLVESKP
jgi:thiol-disulfide isomerase/thioredoxin